MTRTTLQSRSYCAVIKRATDMAAHTAWTRTRGRSPCMGTWHCGTALRCDATMHRSHAWCPIFAVLDAQLLDASASVTTLSASGMRAQIGGSCSPTRGRDDKSLPIIAPSFWSSGAEHAHSPRSRRSAWRRAAHPAGAMSGVRRQRQPAWLSQPR